MLEHLQAVSELSALRHLLMHGTMTFYDSEQGTVLLTRIVAREGHKIVSKPVYESDIRLAANSAISTSVAMADLAVTMIEAISGTDEVD